MIQQEELLKTMDCAACSCMWESHRTLPFTVLFRIWSSHDVPWRPSFSCHPAAIRDPLGRGFVSGLFVYLFVVDVGTWDTGFSPLSLSFSWTDRIRKYTGPWLLIECFWKYSHPCRWSVLVSRPVVRMTRPAVWHQGLQCWEPSQRVSCARGVGVVLVVREFSGCHGVVLVAKEFYCQGFISFSVKLGFWNYLSIILKLLKYFQDCFSSP